MSTLLLRLAGPMQSWGSGDRFGVRFTDREPSKSGVIGLVCAALGRPRSEPVDDLAALRMGVRVEREGRLMRDYHTTGGTHRKGDAYLIATPAGKRTTGTILSTRYFLADADFLVGLEGEDALLEEIEAKLRAPKWQLSLGRKAFVPGLPPYLPGGGLRPGMPLLDALVGEPWPLPCADPPRHGGENGSFPVRMVLEVEPAGSNTVRTDQPLGAAFAERTFGPRWVQTRFAHARPGATPSANEPLTIPLRSDIHVSLSAPA
ncbi:MAG: type I-E CRISPR-associated protein Cas5/CasD [Dehalococcoidia bacterium]|nr:type I-E CRISPR-associated protein Cas5/CasD [Dehalococcoidia bacterium]